MSKQKNKNKKKMSLAKKIVLVILVILLIIIGYFVYGTIRNGGGKQGFVTTVMGQTQEEIQNLEPFSALLLGSSQNLTDTIMIFKCKT